jgi:hypothetical protein
MFFELSPYFYGITIVLQAICVFHCIRKGSQQKWIWIIVFLPMVGCLAYIFTEMFTTRDLKSVSADVSSIINPGGNIRRLEQQLQFTDSFQNRVLLADAYLGRGEVTKAVQLYESSPTGNFTENEHVLKQLMLAYYNQQRFADVVAAGKKIYHQPQFNRSRAHIYYAIAIEKTGNIQLAEEEFKKLGGRFSQYEARYQYGKFLERHHRADEAKQLFNDILNETSHLGSLELRDNRYWLNLVRKELKERS